MRAACFLHNDVSSGACNRASQLGTNLSTRGHLAMFEDTAVLVREQGAPGV